MAGGQERKIRRRIRSVQSTRKITRAMELIAASRIVRAQQAIVAARPYVTQMHQVVADLADTPDAKDHPLFHRAADTASSDGGSSGGAPKVAVIAIAGDRGLSGAYNSSIFRAAERVMTQRGRDGRESMLVAVGRRVDGHFRYRNRPPSASVTGVSDRPSFADAQRIVRSVSEPFEAGDVDEVVLIYTRFVSVGSQEVTTRRLIPLELPDEERDGDTAPGDRPSKGAGTVDYEYEPDPAQILDLLLPRWLEAEVFAALLEASASEYAARQRAMKAATDNADELTKSLTRVMNRARQDAITTEIMEIVGGAEALRQSGGDAQSFNETYVPAEASE